MALNESIILLLFLVEKKVFIVNKLFHLRKNLFIYVSKFETK